MNYALVISIWVLGAKGCTSAADKDEKYTHRAANSQA